MPLLPRQVEKKFASCCVTIGRVMVRLHISPNAITTAGFLMNCVAAILLSRGEFVAAGILILASGLCDALDGTVARIEGTDSVYGAVYDAVLDRLGEMGLFAGLGIYLVRRNLYLTTGVAVVAVAASLLISYVRARAESYNIPCRVGLLRRSERILLLGFGCIFHFVDGLFHEPSRWVIEQFNLPYKYPPMPLTLVVLLIAVLAPITVFQRLWHVRSFGGARKS
jgi:CDP-diacylglycerol---glycerol-3-phosphate 3-phosphatidyltransferase